MNLTDKLNIPGEHAFILPGLVGPLDVELTVPDHLNAGFVALLGHPHSLMGGTMHNKVVTTLARMFKALGIASLRFNFRGVGQSGGVYDAGIGESDDMLFLAHCCLQDRPDTKLLFAGFSFGSYVAWRAAAQHPHALLISIAPPVHHFDYTEFAAGSTPWIVAQGDDDEVVPANLVFDFVESFPHICLLRFAETGHFFHGQLIPLKQRLIDAMKTYDIS